MSDLGVPVTAAPERTTVTTTTPASSNVLTITGLVVPVVTIIGLIVLMAIGHLGEAAGVGLIGGLAGLHGGAAVATNASK